jgi:hypothetical protein
MPFKKLRQLKATHLNVNRYPSPNPWMTERYKAGSVVFSDSISRTSFLLLVSILFGLGLHGGLALRVGMAYVGCVVEPNAGLYIGRPIVDAYDTEEMQDWVGMACHPSCFE